MKVVVLLGGTSPEREVSLRSGGGVGRALASRGHRVTLLDTGTGRVIRTPDEAMSMGSRKAGRPPRPPSLTGVEPWKRALLRARKSVDAVFVALHGGDGEDGTVQGWLERAGFAYTGSGPLSSAMAMDKSRAKKLFRLLGIPTPEWVEVRLRRGAGRTAALASVDDAAIAGLGGFPVVVKPNAVGSSVGITIVRAPSRLRPALLLAARYDERVLVEEFIPGREVTVTVLEGRTFPVVEIIPGGEFYDYKRKYTSGASRYEAPALIPDATARELQDCSVRAFREFGCGGVARVDFRLSPDGRASCLEINTVPGLTELSLVPMSARAAGLSYEELVGEMVAAARARAGLAARVRARGGAPARAPAPPA